MMSTMQNPILFVEYEYNAGEEYPFMCRMRLLLPADNDGNLDPKYRGGNRTIWGHELSTYVGECVEHEGMKWREIIHVIKEKDWWNISDRVEETRFLVLRRLTSISHFNKLNLNNIPKNTRETIKVS